MFRIIGAAAAAANLLCEFRIAEKNDAKQIKNKKGNVILVKFVANSIFSKSPTNPGAIIETNAGLEAAYEIANCSSRIEAMFFGGVDMAAELRCENNWQQLIYARSRVVHAAASAGLDVIDVPYLNLQDLEGMCDEAKKAKDLGFAGKGSVHPKQIAALNDIFTPSKDNITRARRVIKTFEDADTGLVVIDGKLIEKPVMREMYRIVAIADKLGK